jgi:hypothetical protein
MFLYLNPYQHRIGRWLTQLETRTYRNVAIFRAKLNEAASDSEVVATAREMGCTIVTANGLHFEKEIKQFFAKIPTQRLL